MAYRINHIHLKASDPRRTAEWYVGAFGFKIVSDETRVFGDRFIRCQSEDGGMAVNISGPRTGETLQPGNAAPHFGLEHFGFDSVEIENTSVATLRIEMNRAAILRHRDTARVDHDLSPRSVAMNDRSKHRQRTIVKPTAAERRLIIIKKDIVTGPNLVYAD